MIAAIAMRVTARCLLWTLDVHRIRVALSLTALALAACVPPTQLCEPQDPTSVRQCYSSSSPAEAAVVTAEAATLWAVAGGCRSAGCEPHLHCNPQSELCEPRRCSATSQCPEGSTCDMTLRECHL